MFFGRYGRNHRIVGAAYLFWVMLGFAFVIRGVLSSTDFPSPLVYDTLLGMLGIALSSTAALDFRVHRHVQNPASGTLDDNSTVTVSEMIEHTFYQGLNLAQVWYLHFIGPSVNLPLRILALVSVILPWALRKHFPVNSFSANWKAANANPSTLITFLYRIKKYQYLFYKHFLLHGLNISLAVEARAPLPYQRSFRQYWLCLNTSYVMEFFLQTLVKKCVMGQSTMLVLQHILMLGSSAAALDVLRHVHLLPAALSLVLNLVNRGHDVLNPLAVAVVAFAVSSRK